MDLAPDTSESRTDVSLITGGIRQLGRTDSDTEECPASQAVITRDDKMFAVSSVGATSGGKRVTCHMVCVTLWQMESDMNLG